MDPALTEKIKASVDIVDVIKEYIPLKQAGRNFKATCPFHAEKTPSFMVSHEKQIFHCFGCGVGGDSVTFLMKHDNLTFIEAIKILAGKAGINIPESGSSGRSSGYTSKLYEITDTACRFYERYLFTKEGRAAWAYLTKRGLSITDIKKFRIGFSPSSWDMLHKFLTGKGFTEKNMETAGLIIKKEGGGCYDRFRERIIYPIMNETGKIVGFGGRTIKEIEPKYMNSPETPIYRKSLILYALNLSKRNIIKQKRAIIVEGYMDLITLFQFGFDFSVATLGTATTPMQLRLLKRFSSELIFAYDADKAGEGATIRGIEEALKMGFNVKVVELPKGNDPEEVLRLKGRDAMAGLIEKAPDFFNFRIKILEREYSPHDNAEKIKIVRAVLSTIRYIPGALEKMAYIKQLSERYSIPEETLRLELKNFKKDYNLNPASPSNFQKNFSQEGKVMKIILSGGELSCKARRHLKLEDFEDENLKGIMRLLIKLGHEQDIKIDALLNEVAEEKWRSIITGILLEEPDGFSQDALLDEFILKAVKKRQRRKERELLEEIKTEEKNGNLNRVKEKQREYEELIRGTSKIG
ncbi:MAG: DNA primase [Candidatus Omnitrophica bacterium]|nr:DNA primase [Candidatus Omnitrophota bacterium]